MCPKTKTRPFGRFSRAKGFPRLGFELDLCSMTSFPSDSKINPGGIPNRKLPQTLALGAHPHSFQLSEKRSKGTASGSGLPQDHMRAQYVLGRVGPVGGPEGPPRTFWIGLNVTVRVGVMFKGEREPCPKPNSQANGGGGGEGNRLVFESRVETVETVHVEMACSLCLWSLSHWRLQL